MTARISVRRSRPHRPALEAMELRRLLSTVVVTTLQDETIANSTTSLREAITQANAGDKIQWAPTLSGTITLGAAGALHLSKNLIIEGRGAGPTGISGNNASRIFTIDGGVSATIKALTLSGGLAESGGAISNGGTLTLDSVLFNGSNAKGDNASGRGGAIYNSGKLTATSCTFQNNTAQGDSGNEMDGNGLPAYGGAIYNTGTLSLSNASFFSNTAAGGQGVFGFGTSVETQTYGDGGEAFGGAIYSAAGAGSITLSNTILSSNHANGGAGLDNFTAGGAGAAAWGGAVYSQSALTVTGGSWTGNSARAGKSGNGDFDAKDAGGAFGGALWTRASLSVTNASFSDNLAVGGAGGHVNEFFFATAGGGAFGGAIDSETADASFTTCTFENNSATGGINGGGAGGGAIAKTAGKLTITDSTFTANHATGADSPEANELSGGGANGGAVSASGILSVTGSTFSGNGATGGAGSQSGSLHGTDILPAPGGDALGGAIYTTNTSSAITRSTLFGNSATGGAGGSGITIPPPAHGGDASGGGVFATSNLTLIADTIAGNTLIGGVGGEQVEGPNGPTGPARGGGVSVGGTLNIANTIVATNAAATAGPDVSAASAVTSQGFNLIGKTNGSTGWLASDKKGTIASPLDPKLGKLADNGGPTDTMTPLSGSPALDAGKAFGLTTDQRGFVRTFNVVNVANATGGDGTDIGAFELQSTPFSGTPIAINSSGSSTIQAENFDKGDDGVAYHDVESKNLGNVYRTASGVDIQATTDTGGGYNVGWTRAGEWLNYAVNVASSGSYDLVFRVASAGTGGKFHLEVDGINVTGTLSVPNTGGWQTWANVTKSGVSLTSGRHVLRLVMDSVGATGAIGNFNYIKIAPATTKQPIVIKSTTAAYVRDGTFANSNFGNASDLLAKKSTTSYNRETYIKFDLSSAATITSAKLRLFGNLTDANAGSINVGLFAAPSGWDESTITWNKRPATTSQIASFTVIGTDAKTYEIDLTNYLKSEKAAGRNTVTIVLKSLTTSATAATFASDDTASGPQLSIVT